MHTPPAPIPQSKFLLLSIEIYFYLLKEKKKKKKKSHSSAEVQGSGGVVFRVEDQAPRKEQFRDGAPSALSRRKGWPDLGPFSVSKLRRPHRYKLGCFKSLSLKFLVRKTKQNTRFRSNKLLTKWSLPPARGARSPSGVQALSPAPPTRGKAAPSWESPGGSELLESVFHIAGK